VTGGAGGIRGGGGTRRRPRGGRNPLGPAPVAKDIGASASVHVFEQSDIAFVEALSDSVGDATCC
jgi:hypothetical protein